MPYQRTIHPLKRVARRIHDMLLVDAPIWKIAKKLEISQDTIYKHYGHILDQFPDRKPGPREHEPTDTDRAKVKMLAILGATHDEIAAFMEISRGTLEKHYRDELDKALLEANIKVGANLLAMATGPRDLKNTVTAAIWWSKARMGFKDTSRVEQTGADGGPIQTENQVVVILPDNKRDNTIDGVAEAASGISLPAPEDVGADPEEDADE